MAQLIACSPRRLPKERLVEAAKKAVEINPQNHAPVERLAILMPGFIPTPERIAVVTKKYWGVKGIQLTVSFVENSTSTALRKKILSHMNAWSKTANVKFAETKSGGQVRIAFEGGDN